MSETRGGHRGLLVWRKMLQDSQSHNDIEGLTRVSEIVGIEPSDEAEWTVIFVWGIGVNTHPATNRSVEYAEKRAVTASYVEHT